MSAATPPGTQPMGQGAEPNPHEHKDPVDPESKQGKGYKEGKGKDEEKKKDDDHAAHGGEGR